MAGKTDYQVRAQVFEMLYEDYQEPIERYLVARMYDQESAHDLCQETFERFWKFLMSQETDLPQIKYYKNWLYTTATNLVIDKQRRKKLIDFLPLSEDEAELAVEGEEERILERLWRREAIEELPPHYREAVKHRLIGHSERETALILGITEKTVSSNASRGKELLRRKFYQVTIDIRILETKAAFRQSGMMFIPLKCTLPRQTERHEYSIYHTTGNPFYARETVGLLQMDDDEFKRVVFEENEVEWWEVNYAIKNPSSNKLPGLDFNATVVQISNNEPELPELYGNNLSLHAQPVKILIAS